MRARSRALRQRAQHLVWREEAFREPDEALPAYAFEVARGSPDLLSSDNGRLEVQSPAAVDVLFPRDLALGQVLIQGFAR
jgi:hypothetical protein